MFDKSFFLWYFPLVGRLIPTELSIINSWLQQNLARYLTLGGERFVFDFWQKWKEKMMERNEEQFEEEILDFESTAFDSIVAMETEL